MSILAEIKAIQPTKTDLKKFGLTIGTVLALLGGLLFWKDKPYYVWFLGGSGFFVLMGLVLPPILWPIYKFWMGLATVLGMIMTSLILSILFFFAITPMSIIAKIAGKDFLDRKFEKERESYWIRRSPKPFKKEDCEKQF